MKITDFSDTFLRATGTCPVSESQNSSGTDRVSEVFGTPKGPGAGFGSRWIRPLAEIGKETCQNTDSVKQKSSIRCVEKLRNVLEKRERFSRFVEEPLSRFSQEALVAKKKMFLFFSFFFLLHALKSPFQWLSTLRAARRQRSLRNPYGKPKNGGEGERYETGDVEG